MTACGHHTYLFDHFQEHLTGWEGTATNGASDCQVVRLTADFQIYKTIEIQERRSCWRNRESLPLWFGRITPNLAACLGVTLRLTQWRETAQCFGALLPEMCQGGAHGRT